jgi:polyhydroxybutyrate depolymerase
MNMRSMVMIAAVAVLAGLVGCKTLGLAGGGRDGMATRSGNAPVVLARAGGMEEKSLNVGGMQRSYYLYVPANANGALVVAFHGGNQEPIRFAEGVGLRQMADRYGFVVAVPVGVRESWNTGSVNPQGYADENNIDDLSFTAALIDDVVASGVANADKVYAMGVSLGGMMTYNAACNLPGRFDAIAVVAGTLASGQCANAAGVSLLHIHGTEDENVPFEGGAGQFTSSGQVWTSARQGIMTFAASEQCSTDWQTQQISSDTTCNIAACPGGDVVEYCLVQGGGHTWPGVAATKRQQRRGAAATSSFNATDEIATFFLKH